MTTQKPKTPKRGGLPVLPLVVGGIIVLALAAVLATALTGGDDDDVVADGVEQTRPVAVEGTPLPQHDGEAPQDAAVGEPAPRLEGLSFDGTPVRISNDGNAKLIVFLAHWCPHCQAEVPVIMDWVADGGKPDGVDLYGVATGTSADLPNYPPSSWLDEEGWTDDIPTLADDENGSAATAYGLGSYPYFVAVDADGNVVMRGSGELTTEQLDALVAAMG